MRYLWKHGRAAIFVCLAFVVICLVLRAAPRQPELILQGQTVDAAPVQDLDEYAVWSAVLEKKYVGTRSKQLVISDQTWFLATPRDIAPYAYLSADAFPDFAAKSKGRYTLENKFSAALPCILLSRETEDRLFPHTPSTSLDVQAIIAGWHLFYREYPDAHGILTLSRVGFNSDKTQAVVYVSNHASLMVFADRYFILIKKNGSWEILSDRLIRFS